MSVSISIPVTSHVKKYISTRYGNQHLLSKTSLFGILIFSVLDKEPEDPFQCFNEYSEKYTILISDQYFYEKGFTISKKKKEVVAIFLEKMFIEDFLCYVDISVSKMNISVAQSIRVFLNQYDIDEDDLKYETMYKRYQRYCDAKKIKKIAC